MMELLRILSVCCLLTTTAAAACTVPNCAECQSGVDVCSTCQSGYYVNDQNTCTTCGANCIFCTSFTVCNTCQVGFYMQSQGNLTYCSSCPAPCASCTNYTQCTACRTGNYGVACAYVCQDHCVGGVCTQDGCTNGCMDRFYKDSDNVCQPCNSVCKTCSNNACDSCDAGKYGPTCSIPCKSTCLNVDTCDISTGDCESSAPCPEGNYRDSDKISSCSKCSSQCKACESKSTQCTKCHSGYYVYNTKCTVCPSGCTECSSGSSCSSCKERYYRSGGDCAQCNSICATCTSYTACNSCKHGYYLESQQCQQCLSPCEACSSSNHCTSCTQGYYLASQQCLQCPATCSNCSSTDKCHTCKQGYQLESDKCLSTNQCSSDCKDQSCTSEGNCANGCVSSDRYGPRCNQSCSGTFQHCSTCSSTSCLSCLYGHVLRSGACTTCTSGDTDASCNTGGSTSAVTGGGDDSTASVAGGVGGGIAILVAVVVVLCVVIRTRRNRNKSTSKTDQTNIAMTENGNDTDPANIYAKPVKPKRHVSVEINEPISKGDSPAVRLSDVSVQGLTNNVDDGGIDIEEEDISIAQTPAAVPEPIPDTYYNMAGLVRSRIAVDKLQEHVNKKSSKDFVKEFDKLPLGLTRPYTAAMQNRANNRYQKVYPYDASRVVLKSGPTDYINASCIDCYNNYNTYIASLGPTDKTMPGFESFWTMVWQEKVEVIVMLTNLTEGGAMKCEQYWPDPGSTVTYGDVTVTCHSEDIYAEYTRKSFTVQSSETRTLHHIHYTAWPDKGVPDDVTSLIEFRQRVINCPVKLGGPTIVHCSAGVGRTGTYIALDVLTREGRESGAVDVFGCVMALRGQRVSMVQTAEQYEYLHNALVHALTFDCDPIQADKVRQLLTPSHKGSIQTQFEHLNQTNDVISDEEKNAIAKNKAVPHTNRHGADIPGSRHRPLLYMFRSAESSNYINAVFVNSFKQKDRYVVAQTPLPTTVVDFLTLVMQTNCPCIVSLDDGNQHDKTVGSYIPATHEVSQHGIFQVKCNSCETIPHYTRRQLVITAQGSQGQTQRIVYHFQSPSWGKGERVPKDAMSFLQLTRDAEKMAAAADSNGPIIVHCLTGAERSGLFCVVSVLIQKMEIEHQVSVVNTVRQVKARRRRAVLNKEQYQFCHQCLAAYIQSFDTYSNFSQ